MQESLLADDNSVDQNKDYLAELVGEGKKFKTQQDLARGKYEADLYIKTLEQKLDQRDDDYKRLDADYKARAKLEELIDQMNNKSQQQSEHKPPIVNDRDNKPTIDPQQLESLVSSKIQEHEITKKQQENSNIVRSKLIERFGNNYKSVVKEQLQDLGLSEDDFNALARRSPTALFKTLGVDEVKQQENYQPPIRSQQRSDSFKPTAAEVRDWNWYENLRKTNPDKWRSKEMTVQRHKDYLELGERFEAGDPDLKKGREVGR